jgi:hypothetical protein
MSVCTGVRGTASGGLNERRLWCTVSLPPYFPGIHHENLVMFCTECDQISTTTSLLLWPTVFTGLHTRIHSASHCWLPWNDRGILISVVCDRTTSVCSSPLQHHIGHFLMSRCLFVYMHLFLCILALFCSCRWDETRLNYGHQSCCSSPTWYEYGESWWSDIDRAKLKNSETNLSQCHFIHHDSNVAWTEPGANPCFRSERPQTNRLSHGTTMY